MEKQVIDMSRSYMPYPEIVEAAYGLDAWKVRDSTERPWLPSNGVTDKGSRRLYVPLQPDGRPVALHELAHVHWSPDKLPRVRYPLMILQAVEDARINTALYHIGCPMMLDPEHQAHVVMLGASDLKQGRYAVYLLRAIASLGTSVEGDLHALVDTVSPLLSRWLDSWIVDARDRLERGRVSSGEVIAPFRVAARVARDLARELRRRNMLDKDLKVEQLGCCLGHVHEPGDPDEDAPLFRFMRGRSKGDDGPGDETISGEMTIAEPALPVGQGMEVRPRGLRWRPSVEGVRLGRIHRKYIDGAIFHSRVRGGGGSVLVDTSGSMSFDVDDVDAIVHASRGAALVAIYSGTESEGELRIVARGRRRAAKDDLAPYGSGNIVDLPALEWLAEQPKPRIWVSDGRVTGPGDRGSTELFDRCHGLAARAGILRVADAAEAVKALTGRGKGLDRPATRRSRRPRSEEELDDTPF
jgi:hypothetical protein